MKMLKTTIKKLMTLFLVGSVILLISSCSEDAINIDEFGNAEQLINWNDLLSELDLESEIAYVQNGESIQEAIDAALPGEIIYIEPGTYKESFDNNKSDVKLIGLSLNPNDLEIKNAKNKNLGILKLYDKKSIEKFKRNSQNRGKRSRITDFSRTELGAGVAHYRFSVRMGEGEFDVVRIHRVVRESRKYHPVPLKGNVFMVHGAFTGFERTFLANGLESSDDINAKTSGPFYLASKNIDVWGIDMGWTMVSNDDDQDFTFMKGWGYEKDAGHTLRAMRIARMIRGLTGQGFSGLNLLGYSSGNTVAYAAADMETQKPNMRRRHIKGIVSVDNAFKTVDPNSGCVFAIPVEMEIALGQYENLNGDFFKLLADLAIGVPDDPSPIPGFESFTNIQAFRFFFYTNDAIGFHMWGSNLDLEEPIYSDEMRTLRTMSSNSRFMPNQLWLEIDAVNCSSMNVSFDDNLGLINVPILYIGANGGGGAEAGYHTATLTASTDITNQLVSVSGDPATDYGHIDLWTGYNADQLVWSPLRNWLDNHQ